MTERERWVVYPLLFLALGAGLRDKLFDQTRSKNIECQKLIVSSDEGNGREPALLARLGAATPLSSTVSPVGELWVNGLVAADTGEFKTVHVNAIVADSVYSNHYVHGVPFAPTILRALPHMMPQSA